MVFMPNQSPLGKFLKSADGQDIESGLLHDLAERLRVGLAVVVHEGHVSVADGARGGDRLSRLLGAKI